MGVKINKTEHKLALHADNIVCFLWEPLWSMIELNNIAGAFGAASGYKVNQQKSIILGLQIDQSTKQAVQIISKSYWRENRIKYLGCLFCQILF